MRHPWESVADLQGKLSFCCRADEAVMGSVKQPGLRIDLSHKSDTRGANEDGELPEDLTARLLAVCARREMGEGIPSYQAWPHRSNTTQGPVWPRRLSVRRGGVRVTGYTEPE